MTPVREGDTRLAEDPIELARQGKVTDLSKADMQALDAGADFNKVANGRMAAASLTESGTVLARNGRMTPAGIFNTATTRDEARTLLASNGYLL